MRDLYVRHREHCKKAKKGSKNKPPRQIFGCGCPIYARYEIRDLVTGSVLERFNGSLQGITTREAAEEYLDSRFSNVRSGQIRANTKALTVAEAIERFIAEKKSSMPPPAKVQVSERVERAHQRFGKDPNDREREIIVKHRASLGLLQSFCDARRVKYITDVTYEHLAEFQQTWKGKSVTDPVTREKRFLEPSQVTKQKNQEFLRAFFRRATALGWIQKDPTARLLPIKTRRLTPKPITEEQKQKLLDIISKVHPNHAEIVQAFLYVQIFAAPRISDVVQLEVQHLTDEGIFLPRQQKTDEPVSFVLPPFVVNSLRKLTPKSERYFFWTGNGQAESAAKHWSAMLLKLFRAAGIPDGQRSHEWRDTMATKLMSEEGGRLEDAQLALGHTERPFRRRSSANPSCTDPFKGKSFSQSLS